MTTTATEFIGHAEFLAIAYDLMDRHLPGWSFRWDNAAKRLGACKYGPKVLSFSRPLTARISRRQAVDTITHEIAHALAGHQAGHGPEWARVHRDLGGSGDRTYSTQTGEVVAVEPPFQGTCPGCGRSWRRHKRIQAACPKCSAAAGSRFDTRFLLVWTRVG